MNKQGLIDAIAKETRISKVQVEQTLDSMMRVIQHRVSQGEDVTLMGFGTFFLAERKARRGHDPHREKAIEIPAMMLPKFRAGKEFKLKVGEKKAKY